MNHLRNNFFPPIQKVLLSFILLILLGSILLYSPFSTFKGISFIDAFFTSTSAVCVTGLIVKDTATIFTPIGKGIILMLIQFGGLGIMTFSLGLLTILGGNLSIKWRFTFKDIYSEDAKIPIKKILVRIVKYTFAIESIITLILFSQFYKDFPLIEAIGNSIFHSISAFCNAGFSTFSNNLIDYRNNTVVNLATSSAIILGGVGFIVLNDIFRIKIKSIKNGGIFKNFSFHTKIVLISSFILIITGMILFLFLEWNHGFKEFSMKESLLTAFFQSVSCRTAGFNTIDINILRNSTHFIMVILMLIGGSPGSIAGGIKTTTIVVIFYMILSKFKGRDQILINKRALSHDTVNKTTTLVILSFIFITISTFLMLVVKEFDMNHSFLSILFETVSAFGTVGLSMGITDQLPSLEKFFIVIIMFTGRLGPLTLLMALSAKSNKAKIKYPEENIMIG